MKEDNIRVKPAQEQFGSVFRQALIATGGYMVGKGWLNAELTEAWMPVVLIALPVLWSQRKILRRSRVLKQLGF